MLGMLLLAACSTQVPHPLLEPEMEERVTTIDLAQPPATAQAADEAPEEPPVSAADSGAATPAPAPAPAGAESAMPVTPPSAPPTDVAPLPAPGAAPVTPTAGAPDERLDISVADVRSQAITNNLEIRTELIRPAISGQEREEAEARFLPTAFARYTYSKFDEPGVAPVRNPNGTTTDAAELGLQIPLQTGGTATISVPLTRTDFGVPGIQNIHDASTVFSLSQPLLRDAGRAVNLAPITVARLRERQQDANTKLAIMNVLASADRAYWQLYAASRAVEVRLQQYARAKEQERQAVRLSEEGVVPAIEITRARAGVARRIDDIIRAENSRRQVEREVKRAMNREDLPVSGATALLVTTQPDPREIVIDRPAALATASDNRMELIALELQLAVDSLTVDVTRNQKLPRLALDYSFRYLGASNELGESLDMIGTQDFEDQSIGLTLEVPLDNQARRARYHQAVLARALNAATREQRHQLIERQVLDTADQLDEAWQRILAAREETLLAARNWQAEQRQFIAGVRTSTDVLIAADFLADAQVRELNALAAYEIAKIDIAFATGTLLGNGRVELASFDETHDITEVAASDLGAITREPLQPAGPPQETISEKLDRLGVRAPKAGPGPGVPGVPAAVPPASSTAPASPGAGAPGGEGAVEPPVPAAGGDKTADIMSAPEAGSEPGGTLADTADAVVAEPAAPAADPATAAGQVGPVGPTDTLWSLARTHRPTPEVSIPVMVDALLRANPELFPDRQPGRLREGAVLRLPTASELAASAP